MEERRYAHVPERFDPIVIGGGLSYGSLNLISAARGYEATDPLDIPWTPSLNNEGPRGSSRKSDAHAKARRKQQRISRRRNRK